MSLQQCIADFLNKWGPGGLGYHLNERHGAQQHFVELCDVLDVPAPVGGEDLQALERQVQEVAASVICRLVVARLKVSGAVKQRRSNSRLAWSPMSSSLTTCRRLGVPLKWV